MRAAHFLSTGRQPTRRHRRFGIATALSIWLLPIFDPMAGAAECADLVALALPDAAVTSAVAVPAQAAVPAYCRVLVTAGTQTDIEVRLPELWRGRLVHLGGSGLDGFIQNLDASAVLLQQGFAVTASNSGHRDPTGGPTRFLNDPAVIAAYAHGAIGQTIVVAKAIVLAHYAEPAPYTYFAGCSAGGRGA
jgi:feruloyl esterase